VSLSGGIVIDLRSDTSGLDSAVDKQGKFSNLCILKKFVSGS
jgi:hypothetical protein